MTSSHRRASILLLAVVLACFALPLAGTAQSARRPSPPQVAALRALVEGRFDDVDAMTDKLDGRDPNVVAIKAQAAIARGRYAPAEALLRPVVARAPASEAALHLGLLMKMLGRPDARPILQRVALLAETSDDPLELARAARALRALDKFHESEAAYRDADSAAPNNPAINTAWGELFLEKYAYADALKSFQIALQVDPKWAPALLGSAQALEDENPPQAIALAKRALEINPSSVEAQLFLAEQAADADHHDEARAAIEKALAVNPSSLDAHALLAALAYVADKASEFDAEVAKTLAIAPSYGEVYRAAGEMTAHKYRFDEAVALTRRALAINAREPRALADLGLQLLRTGDEAAARVALDASFTFDPFNRTTLNLLTMMDNLDKFVTVRDGDLIVRMSKDEAPVLQEYAIPLAHKALATFSARYEFTPKGPILIEIFPKHDDFAVRTMGLPGMTGALGVCFGRVVGMDSPKARPPGEFQWEATLWHELAHVVTLQMSNQRIPRWLTEGISEYEEKRARPEWGRELDMAFAGMLNRGEAIKLKELNAAFQNPKLISIAYFQGSLIVEHIVNEYGEAALRQLIRSYGQGLETDAALKATVNTDFAGMQAGFDKFLDKQFGALQKAMTVPADAELLKMPLPELRILAAGNPGSYPVQFVYGRALRKAGQVDDAVQAFERAAKLVPIATGADSPHAQLAEIAIERKDRPRAIAELTALIVADFNNVEAARQLAGLLRQEKVSDPARLGFVFQRIAAIDPFDGEAHASLGRLAMRKDDADAAAREFRSVVALSPVDRALALTDLAESYFKGGKRAEAKKQVLAALEVAPTYERAQDLLLKIVGGDR
jgi:tetratricopeptide (TPR) repeat protein